MKRCQMFKSHTDPACTRKFHLPSQGFHSPLANQNPLLLRLLDMHQSLPREVHIHFFSSSTIRFSLSLAQTPAARMPVASSVSQTRPSSGIPTLAYSRQISRHLEIHPISSPSRKDSQAIAGSRGHSFPWRPNCASSLFSVTLHLMRELHIQIFLVHQFSVLH